MLSGGQGDIRPVMGGGFSLMALGQPETPSLMNGDVPPAPIVAVGGSQEGGLRALEPEIADAVKVDSAAAAAAAAAARVAAHKESVKLISNPRVEFYKLDKKAEILDKYSASIMTTMLKQSRTDVKDVVTAYKTKHAVHWGGTPPPNGNSCAPGQDISKVPKLVHFISDSGADIGDAVETIVLLPPVAGKLSRFDYLLTFLSSIGVMSNVQDEIGTIVENARIVFMPPFYGNLKTSEGIAHDLTLNYMFMKFKALNEDKVFVLAEHTPANIEVGCALKQQYELPQDDALVNMLEPSYIVYKGPVERRSGIIITSNATHNGLTLEPLINTEYNTFINTGLATDITGYLTFTSADARTVVPPGPSRTGQCEPLIADISASTVSSPFGFKDSDKIAVIRLYAPTVNRKPMCEVKNVLEGLDRFFSADMKRITRAQKINIIRNGKLYRIRKGSGKVKSNWLAGVFTSGGKGFSGEADLLNDLGISPKLLHNVFRDEWNDKLCEFLMLISISKCFTDEGLLTYKECDAARAFVRQIETNLLMNNLDNIKVEDPALEIPQTMNAEEATLEEATPGEFMLDFEFGAHKAYRTITGWIMPVIIVSNKTNQYLLRNIVVNKIDITEYDIKDILNLYKKRYPEWNFLN